MATNALTNEGYRAAAQLLDDFRAELARRQAAHTDLVLRLSESRTETVTRTASEAAEMLLAGSVPNSRADDLRAAQAEEEAMRRQLEAMVRVERGLTEAMELARIRAREAAIRDDPRTVQIAKRWQAAEQAVRAALDLEGEQTQALLSGAFGQPDDRRPAWLNYWALN
jgi:hypothetical protein